MTELYHTAEQLPLFATPSSIAPSKTCTACDKEKPLEEFYKTKLGKYGRQSVCKECSYPRTTRKYFPTPKPGYKYCRGCEQEKVIKDFTSVKGKTLSRCKVCDSKRYRDRWDAKHVRKVSLQSNVTKKEHKVCNTCFIEKPFEAFDRNGQQRDGHNGRCKICAKDKWNALSEEEKTEKRLRDRQSRIPRHEQIIERDRRRHNTDNHRAKRRERMAQRTASDPLYRETRTQSHAEWRRNNPLAYREHMRKVKARRKNVKTERVSYKHILERDGMWCYICEKPIHSKEKMQFDHVIPLSPRCGEPQGTHSEDNIKITHALCNNRKKNKPLSALTPFDRRGVDHSDL